MNLILIAFDTERVWCTLIICIAALLGLCLLCCCILQLFNCVYKSKKEQQEALFVHEKELREMDWKHKIEWERELRGYIEKQQVNGMDNKPSLNS